MKLYTALFYVLITILGLPSCKDRTIEDAANKKEYIEYIYNLNDDERKAILLKDAQHTSALIDSIKDIRLYYTMSFGAGGSGNTDIEGDKSFSLTPTDSIKYTFSTLENIEAEQVFALPESGFKFYYNDYLNYIDFSNIKYDVKQIFVKDRIIDNKDFKLQKADSLQVTASYSFSTSFDTIVISPDTKDSVQYNKYTIEIDNLGESEVEVEYPIGIKVIGYQAIYKDSILMNSNSSSNFPVVGLNPDVVKQIENAVSILKAASEINDKEKLRAELEKLDDKTIATIKELKEAIVGYEQIRKDKKDKDIGELIGELRRYMEKHADILIPIVQHLEIGFPKPFSKVQIYVSSHSETLTKDLIAICDSENNDNKYNIYVDKTLEKYGIIDNESNIIIPASYSRLYRKNDSFFEETIGYDTIVSYKLNPQEKKLERLPNNIRFENFLNDDLIVFSDKDAYYGVLNKDMKEIVPYKYDYISLFGNIILAKGSKRGRSFYQFYSTDGHQIKLPEIIKEIQPNKGGDFIIKGKNDKLGILNKEGVLSIPIEYDLLDFLDENDLFIYQKNNGKTLDDDLCGIINSSGKIVTQPIFSYIRAFSEELAAAYTVNGYGQRIGGFINQAGIFVIKPQYSKVSDFYKGYVLVCDEDNQYFLIDKKGNTIKKFSPEERLWYTKGVGENAEDYYESEDGKKYNYMGEPII